MFPLYDTYYKKREKGKTLGKDHVMILADLPVEHKNILYLFILHHSRTSSKSERKRTGKQTNTASVERRKSTVSVPYKGRMDKAGKSIKFSNVSKLPTDLIETLVCYLDDLSDGDTTR